MKLIAFLPLAALLGASAAPSDLVVTIESKGTGKATVCLWSSSEGFPDCQKGKPFRKMIVDVTQGRNTVGFDNVPAGRYAVSVALDANGNGKIDTNLLGIPKEPVGVSGKPAGLGKPSFKSAEFTHPEQPATVRLSQ